MNERMLRKFGGEVIEIRHESGWRKPIQATYWFLSIRGEICHHYYFSEWDSIKEAIRFFSHHYTEPIFINQQTQFYLSDYTCGKRRSRK